MIKILKHFQDPDLGEISFRKNSRAKRYIIRYRKEKVNITIPWLGNLREAEVFFEKNRDKLIPLIQKIRRQTPEEHPSLSSENIMLLKEKAINYLPEELARLAQNFKFYYKSCKIGKSRTHWGSCSSSGTIRLSFYLMLLPENLIQYVLLHELCHTVHHNHGENFWSLLNSCTDGKAKPLRKELRGYSIPQAL